MAFDSSVGVVTFRVTGPVAPLELDELLDELLELEDELEEELPELEDELELDDELEEELLELDEELLLLEDDEPPSTARMASELDTVPAELLTTTE